METKLVGGLGVVGTVESGKRCRLEQACRSEEVRWRKVSKRPVQGSVVAGD